MYVSPFRKSLTDSLATGGNQQVTNIVTLSCCLLAVAMQLTNMMVCPGYCLKRSVVV